MTTLPAKFFVRRRFLRGIGVVLTLAVACAASGARAEDTVRAAQTALKAKGYLYGAPDGTLDAETHSAIRRYQIHEGLPINGELDASTARALGIAAAPAPTAAPAKSAPVAKSSAARGESAGRPQQADRIVVQPTPEPAPEPATLLPPAPAPVQGPRPVATAKPAATTLTPRPVGVAASPASASLPPASVNGRNPMAVPRPRNLDGEMAAFVNNYLVAGAAPEIDGELGMYADVVDYFNDGQVNRGFIRRDTTNYRARWPKRDYLLEGRPAVVNANAAGTAVTVRFRLRYRVQAGLHSAAGHTETTMELQRGPRGTFSIVSVKEAKLGRS